MNRRYVALPIAATLVNNRLTDEALRSPGSNHKHYSNDELARALSMLSAIHTDDTNNGNSQELSSEVIVHGKFEGDANVFVAHNGNKYGRLSISIAEVEAAVAILLSAQKT